MAEHEATALHDHRRAYYAVFAALMVATVLTVLAAQIWFGSRGAGIVVAIVIACVKASLVAYIFMHLKDEERFFYAIALLPLILFMVLVFLLLPDVGLAQVNPLDDPSSPLHKPFGQGGAPHH